MTDDETMAVYAEAAERYAKGFGQTKDTNQDADYAAFTSALPPPAHVLDLGCGPGHWAARFAADGYQTSAVDASPEMARYAKATHSIEVTIGPFSALQSNAPYDGIWANFSLLHLPRTEFGQHLKLIHGALQSGGVLSLGMKLGSGERRDKLGRFFSYYREDELRSHLIDAGFSEVFHARRGNGAGLAGAPETFVVLTSYA